MIRTNIRGRKYSNIFEYPNIRHTMVQAHFADVEAVVGGLPALAPLVLV